jgi:protein phosphatase
MGGAAGGEIASRIAAESMMRAMGQGALTAQRIRQAVCEANLQVFSQAQGDPSLAGMGTTLVALGARDSQGWLANVGDSRCYRLRGGHLERLTQDHSLVDEQVRRGELTPAQAEASPMRNVITRAIGTAPEVEPDIIGIDIVSGDLYLLASDGLTREVSDGAIEQLTRGGGQLDELCAALIDAANRAGGSDNITCVLVRVI